MSLVRFCATLALVAGMAGPAAAKPYASIIRVNNHSTGDQLELNIGAGGEITYFLNETADSVTIEIQNTANDAIVATFPGTTSSGENSVTWVGTTDNNPASANVPVGNYQVLITASKANTAWADIASHRSAGGYGPAAVHQNLYDGFSPNYMLFVSDPASDQFGRSFANSSYGWGAKPALAATEFLPDLTLADGLDGYDSRVFRLTPLDGTVGATSSQYSAYHWVGSIDPNDADIFYYTGQVAPYFWFADLNSPLELQNGDPNGLLTGLSPRSVVVVYEGSDKYAYFTNGLHIYKVGMTGNILTGSMHVAADLSGNNRYSRTVRVDPEGNLYFVSRGTGTAATTGAILRWDYEDTVGATPTLTEANASWIVTAAPEMSYLTGPAISPTDGNVYVASATANTVVPGNGIYLVGNTSDATINRTLSSADMVVDTAAMNWGISQIYHQVTTDPAGNIVYIDRAKEQIRMFTPGGQSDVVFPAPDSQNFNIIDPSNVDNWALY